MVNTSMTSARTFAELKHHDDFPSLTGLERGGHRLELIAGAIISKSGLYLGVKTPR